MRTKVPSGPTGGRVGEAVADGDHALETPDLVDDVSAEHGATGDAFQRDDPVVHGHREAGRVGKEPVRDHVLGDLAADLLVGPAEDAQHVGPADDADQMPVTVNDREPLKLERSIPATNWSGSGPDR